MRTTTITPTLTQLTRMRFVNAFLVRDTPYHWMRGSRMPLERS